jgi:SOS-response transcriptional repressor LexA
MSPKQSRVLKWVKVFLTKHEYSPSYREIAKGAGLSLSNAFRVVRILAADGHLTVKPGRGRSIWWAR